jgi:hypothetical protein
MGNARFSMNVHENIELLRQRTTDLMNSYLAELESSCIDRPDISEFLDIVLNTCDDYHELSHSVTHAMRMLVWEISEIDLQHSPYGSNFILEDLNSFIGNYFFDDSYFLLEKNKRGEWTAVSNPDYGSQNVELLINCAKENGKLALDMQLKFEKRMEELRNLK